MDNRGVITLRQMHTQATLAHKSSAGKKSELDTSVPMSKGKTDKHPEMQLMQSCKCAWEDCVEAGKRWLESYQ